ncbi:hypothetical protein [Herbiconiux flava]|uniref:Uncharacterized protein n=1 Tax=Herbiconiux flava TaxID=881268 RepID=A0A852SMY7_9MICO|nr:hypothetical protein [Herbiconiux flava]NYD70191.1 hypothetical protein [Herbiconiux flava]GLK16944.1 hypothetical protein GCM10017602_14260 [Herbiconiux flava]
MSMFGGKKNDPLEPGKSERENNEGGRGDGTGDPNKPTPTRIAIWIIVGGVGLYLVGSGIFGILTH